MHRRDLLKGGCGAALAAAQLGMGPGGGLPAKAADWAGKKDRPVRPALLRHRFGVHYAPPGSWFHIWNDFDADVVARDLDAIASLGADHLRMFLVWPYFQPNRKWVSPAHLERLDRLMRLSGDRGMDIQLSMLNGWISSVRLLTPFDNPARPQDMYRSGRMFEAHELYFREVAKVAGSHPNFLGFDIANEMSCCWSTGADTAAGDAWFDKILTLAESLFPRHLHVNGTWGQWMSQDTFSAGFLAARQECPVLHCYPLFAGALRFGGHFDRPSIELPAIHAALVRAYAGDPFKPVWLQEYGMCNDWMPDAARIPEFLERTTLAAIRGGISWLTWWASHDVDRKFELNPLEYGFGLLTVDNQIKPQGRKFRELAERYRGRPVSFDAMKARPLPPPPAKYADTWKWLLDWMEYEPKGKG
jgi:endo-1,4-beta-mannosidase